MGIVVVPGRFSAPVDQVGRLAHTLLGVALAGGADRQRLQRGRLLLAERAVLHLEVEPGVLRALVQGGRPDAYPVVVTVPMVPRPALRSGVPERSSITSLVPDMVDLLTSCGCPDRDDPCKHAIAAVLAFADELTMRPSLLVEWRCVPDDSPLPEIGSRARRPALRLATDADTTPPGSARPPRPGVAGTATPDDAPDGLAGVRRLGRDDAVRPSTHPLRGDGTRPETTREQRATRHPDWPGFVGSLPIPFAPELPDDVPPLGHAVLGAVDLVEWLATALAAMREA